MCATTRHVYCFLFALSLLPRSSIFSMAYIQTLVAGKSYRIFPFSFYPYRNWPVFLSAVGCSTPPSRYIDSMLFQLKCYFRFSSEEVTDPILIFFFISFGKLFRKLCIGHTQISRQPKCITFAESCVIEKNFEFFFYLLGRHKDSLLYVFLSYSLSLLSTL